MISNPFFSLIIPTYNRAEFLLKTIQSVLDQDYKIFEIIIVDDGSTDETAVVVGEFDDDRIKYLHKKNEERAIARNYGIQNAKGEYITFLDSDDALYPNCFAEALALIKAYDSPEWFHLGYEIRNVSGTILRRENKRKGNINGTLITGNHLSCIGVFVRKDIAQANLFDENPSLIGSEDYDLWLRLSVKYTLHYSNAVTATIIQHKLRSVLSFPSNKLINRIDYHIGKVQNLELLDQEELENFMAHRYLYLSLHLLVSRHYKKAYKYLENALKAKPGLLFSKKFLGILKATLESNPFN